MLSAAETMRARTLLRRHLVATVALGVFAGLAAGAALGLWGIARRTATVHDRFVDYEGAAQLALFSCGDVDVFAPAFEVETCASYDYADIVEFLDDQPGIEAAGRLSSAVVELARVEDPDSAEATVLSLALDDAGMQATGRPLVVEGRVADPTNPSEANINEEFAHRYGVGVGDQVIVTPFRPDQFEVIGNGSERASGDAATVTVVGVLRRPFDLAGRLGATRADADSTRFDLGPGWWDSIDGEVASYGSSLAVLADGTVTAESLLAMLSTRWPDRFFDIDSGLVTSPTSDATAADAISLEATSLRLIAAILAVAAIVFAGQAVSRQMRTEWADRGVFAALGMTSSAMVRSVLLRAAPIAAVAGLVAATTAVATSPLGPFGIGRAAETSPGVRVDGAVLAVGLPIVVLVVLAFAVAPVVFGRRRQKSADEGFRVPATTVLPPSGVAGVAMFSTRRAGGVTLWSAIAGLTLAAVVGVAALTLVASYDDLLASPGRFGATWDVTVANVASSEQLTETLDTLEGVSGITAAGINAIEVSGVEGLDSLVAFGPMVGDVGSPATITSGRAPAAADEVALGRRSLAVLGASIGDPVELAAGIDDEPLIFTVVGEAAINDNFGAAPGSGGLFTLAGLLRFDSNVLPQNFAVWVDDGADADRAEVFDNLREVFPTSFSEPGPAAQIRDLGLIADQPLILAAIVALLAGAALIHALVMSVRRGRHQVGVLQTLGFTRRQVIASVGWHATTLAVIALVIGVPSGVIVGRVLWRAIADDLGVLSPPVLVPVAMLAVIVLVLAVANLAALGPGIAASRTRPAAALRTE